LKGKNTYYAFTMGADNMNKEGGDGSAYTNLFSSSNTSWLASRCAICNSSYANFRLFYVSSSRVNAYALYGSDDSANLYGLAVRPVVTINLKSVQIGGSGEGTANDTYTITKK